MAIIKCPECNHDVSDTAVACPSCGYGIKKHFDDIKLQEKRQEQQRIAAEKARARKKKFKIVIPLILLALAIIIPVSTNAAILSQRRTFKTEEEMVNYLNGDWESDDFVPQHYRFAGKHGSYLSSSYVHGEELVLTPKRGFFEFSGKKFVIDKKSDTLVCAKDTYAYQEKKGIYTKCPKDYTLEDGFSALQIGACSYGKYSEYLDAATGTITNRGRLTYSRFVELDFVVHYSDGTTVEIPHQLVELKVDDLELDLTPGDIAVFNTPIADDTAQTATGQKTVTDISATLSEYRSI